MQTKTFRLLPTGATLSSGALTCLAAAAGTLTYIIKPLNQHQHETSFQFLDAPQRALYALGDAALADGREPSDSQHPTAVPHHGPAEPLPALSGTPPTALRPAHTSHLGLPLPPAQPACWRCRNLPAHEGRSRRHHHPPPQLALLLHHQRADCPSALRVAARLSRLRPAHPRAPRHYVVGPHLLSRELPKK